MNDWWLALLLGLCLAACLPVTTPAPEPEPPKKAKAMPTPKAEKQREVIPLPTDSDEDPIVVKKKLDPRDAEIASLKMECDTYREQRDQYAKTLECNCAPW